jgi:CxxC motif-containing protein (DUF1111 family)/predicted lipoprotein with Yx(FWY)xxD motif
MFTRFSAYNLRFPLAFLAGLTSCLTMSAVSAADEAALIIFTDSENSEWALWDCCAGSTPSVETDDVEHGQVAEFDVLASAETVQGFTARDADGAVGGTPFDASTYSSTGTLSLEMKVVTAPAAGTPWFLKLESDNAATGTGDYPLNASNEGLDPVTGEWQTYTFNLADLAAAGLDISAIDVIMIFPAWGQGAGAVYRIDNVQFSTGLAVSNDMDEDGVIDEDDAFPSDPTETIDTDGDGIGNNADTDDDNDGVSDVVEIASGSDPLDANSVPEALTLIAFDDVDGDGVPSWLSYKITSSQIRVNLLSGDDFVSSLDYNLDHNFLDAKLHRLTDRNADGISELGVFGFNAELNRYQLVVHDGGTGQKLDTWNWSNPLIDASLEVLADLSGDGIEEYAINGIHADNGTRQVVVKDGDTKATYQTFSWQNQWDNTQIVTMSDVTADGVPEVALYGRHTRIDKGQLFMLDGVSGTKVEVYNWNPLWTNLQVIQMDDVDGEGTIDWGQFGQRKDDGRYQWVVKKGHDKTGVIRTFSWPADLENVSPMLVADRTDDGVRDVAIVGTGKTDGKLYLRINDGKLANQRIANISWPANWEDQIVQELGDLNGDGYNEYAMLGYLKTNRDVQLVIQDGQTLTEYGRYTNFGDWQELLLSHYDVNGDDSPDVMISGIDQATGYRHYTFLNGTNLAFFSEGLINNIDSDGDGVLNDYDAFPDDPTESLDTDSDGTGNNADIDDDGDGYLDADEIAADTDPLNDLSLPVDSDGDFISDVTDTDDDNDGVLDSSDLCPNSPPEEAVDASGCPPASSGENDEITSADGKLVGGQASDKPDFVVYVFDSDLAAPGTSACSGGCADSWPPLLVSDGVASGVTNLGSIERADGGIQVTYNERPLYFYVGDSSAGQNNGDNVSGWHSVEFIGVSAIVPLYNESTVLEPIVSYVRSDGVFITRVGDRGRDRHAKDIGKYDPNNIFNSDHYDHWLAHYWEFRTARIQLEDHVPNGQSLIRATFITEEELGAREFRVWYSGLTTTGQFHFNPQKQEEKVNPNEPGVVYVGKGTWNDDFEKISEDGHQYMYSLDITTQWQNGGQFQLPLQVGVNMEFEVSQFLLAPPAGARKNYYGTSYVYVIGTPGLAPFEWQRGVNNSGASNDGTPIPAKGLSGGDTTLGYNYSEEPAGRFIEMATNLSPGNAQPFVRGRRVHHTNFEDGSHDERLDNPIWIEQVGKAGNHYINHSCAACHVRNGRALVADEGEILDQWVFKVADADGNADPLIGNVLQTTQSGNISSEGTVALGQWTELDNGLRSPNYVFSNGTPARFSARIAPQLIGLGLLDALTESTILEWADPEDSDSDGISGRAALVDDPVTGDVRLGRFGYKAATSSVEHQLAAALNTDMGVMTSILPAPDCGSQQTTCGNAGQELADDQLDDLVKYISLLGVGARRDYDNDSGEFIFADIGCANCHRPTMTTSEFHPLAELRSQTIHPYSDMLVHDMGAGLADNLGQGDVTGTEWRTTPLWGLGHSKSVMLGDAKANDEISMAGDAGDVNRIGYLHDGRARTIDEAIRWHGGEALNAKTAYEGLSSADQIDLLDFLNSL